MIKKINNVRSILLFFRAIKCQAKRDYERALVLGLKAEELTPEDESVAQILHSAYSSLGHWVKAHEICVRRLEKDPENYLWNYRFLEASHELHTPIEYLLPNLEKYVDEYEEHDLNLNDLPLAGRFFFFIIDLIFVPFILLRYRKFVRFSNKFKESLGQESKANDEYYQWAVKTLKYHEKR